MLSTQSRRIRPAILQADRDSQVTLGAMPDYQPSNPAFSKENVESALTAMQAARQAEILAQTALDTARDAAAAAEWRFHEIMLGVKTQVIAQYGKDSDELQALGLKKISEHKRAVRRQPENPPKPA
ncbi:MAG: hypothetical protein EHM33_16430 [Chloroflexi bacterium]|nr:MAG: hypothetical protein EHM33_16430 [Chloroflexota bacterium]